MQIFPAIDLRGGKCVRLRQGDYAQETIFGDDPVAIAKEWVRQGAQILHLVDLDGARAGYPVNGGVVRAIVETTGVPCQLGGGIRTEAHVQEIFALGVERIVLGTRALQDPEWVRMLAQSYEHRIVLGLDARDGMVATHGWLNVSATSVFDVAREFSRWPLAGLVFTDIRRDGMLNGPNFEALAQMVQTVELPVIASGGVSTLEDVLQLKPTGVAGCIIGRALYEGQIDLAGALAVAWA